MTEPTGDQDTATVPFQIMPPLTPDEYAALEASITEHGVLTPVVVDEQGVIIDGHHRQEIALKLDVFCARRTIRDLTDEQKIAMALTLNVHRRHLTREQRRELLALSLKAEPEASDREHGRRTGTDNKTAAKVRTDMEGREEIPHVDKRIDTKGRGQPAPKPTSDTAPVVENVRVARGIEKRQRTMLENWAVQWNAAVDIEGYFGGTLRSWMAPEDAKRALREADAYLAHLNRIRRQLRERADQGAGPPDDEGGPTAESEAI